MAARSEILRELSARIRQMERSRIHCVREETESSRSAEGLSRLLPDAVSLRGGLIEWLSDQHGAGSLTLAILAAQPALANDLWVFVDGAGQWHAPGFVPLSLDLQRIVFVKPERPSDMLWAVEQALRTRGVGAVVCEIDRLAPAAFRRLQLAAEIGGGLGILLRPERARHQPSWAECRLLIRPLATAGSANGSQPRRRLLVELLRAKGSGWNPNLRTRGIGSESLIVELNDADGRMCVASELAVATPAARAAGA